MSTTITRHEDCNERSREDRHGRIRLSRSTRVVWVVKRDGEFVSEYERLKDAKVAFPEATVVKE